MTAIIHLQGHLGKDVEVNTVNGQTFVNFTLATNERLKEGDKTTWWRLGYWHEISDKLKNCLKKGSALQVVAMLKTPEIYVDQSGNSRVQLAGRIVHFGFPPFGKRSDEKKTTSQQEAGNPGREHQADDDYLPF